MRKSVYKLVHCCQVQSLPLIDLHSTNGEGICNYNEALQPDWSQVVVSWQTDRNRSVDTRFNPFSWDYLIVLHLFTDFCLPWTCLTGFLLKIKNNLFHLVCISLFCIDWVPISTCCTIFWCRGSNQMAWNWRGVCPAVICSRLKMMMMVQSWKMIFIYFWTTL